MPPSRYAEPPPADPFLERWQADPYTRIDKRERSRLNVKRVLWIIARYYTLRY